jgi:hypothetical protein
MELTKKKMKFTLNEHRTGLIRLYEEQMEEAGPYMRFTLRKAIYFLKNGADPGKVEDWVVKMEKEMRATKITHYSKTDRKIIIAMAIVFIILSLMIVYPFISPIFVR